MPENFRDEWRAIKHFEKFPAGSTLVSICHNCSAIFEERHPEIFCESIWELILSDEKFPYKNFHGEKISVQDCWRSKENFAEQTAVREILRLFTLSASAAAQPRARPEKISSRRKKFIPRAHARTEKNFDAGALRPNPDGKSCGLLSLLRSRIKIGQQKSFSLGRTFIRGRWTILICRN